MVAERRLPTQGRGRCRCPSFTHISVCRNTHGGGLRRFHPLRGLPLRGGGGICTAHTQHLLFLAEIDLHRDTREIPVPPYRVFKEAAVVLAHVLRQVAEKHELGCSRRQLHRIFYSDILPLYRGWRSLLHDRQHVVVELRCRDAAAP